MVIFLEARTGEEPLLLEASSRNPSSNIRQKPIRQEIPSSRHSYISWGVPIPHHSLRMMHSIARSLLQSLSYYDRKFQMVFSTRRIWGQGGREAYIYG